MQNHSGLIIEIMMRRAIQLARRSSGYTFPNPLVGCVITHQDRIIGEGWHHGAGLPHAEVMAVRSVSDDKKPLLRESTVYVTLEPCSHFGRTPPCADLLVKTGVKKVVIGSNDPNPMVAGRGMTILEQAGIEIEFGVLEDECRRLNVPFIQFFEQGKPYVIAKWAESSDGFMDQNFAPVPISNPLTNQYSHHLRSEIQSILIGRKTLETDLPSLNIRHWFGKNPDVIILSGKADLDLPKTLLEDKTRRVFILNPNEETLDSDAHVICYKFDFSDFKTSFYGFCQRFQIQSVLVEGGAATLENFFGLDMVDEVFQIQSQRVKLMNGTPAPHFSFSNGKRLPLREDLLNIGR